MEIEEAIPDKGDRCAFCRSILAQVRFLVPGTVILLYATPPMSITVDYAGFLPTPVVPWKL